MAPKVKPNLVKKLLIVGGVLAALQLGVIMLLDDGEEAPNQKDAIDQAVNKIADVTPERKQMMRVQIALADYMAKNQGRPPASLVELVPTYFDSLPTDPSTGKPYKYKVDGNKYFLGEQTSQGAAPSVPSGAGKTPKAVGTPGGSEADKEALLASLSDETAKKNPPYDSSGKRDPFKALDLSPKQDGALAKTPLEAFPLDRLMYSAFLQSDTDPKAIIETAEGRGFTVTKGMKIGPNNGEITEILPDKIIIVETEIDFTGEKRTRTAELFMGMKIDGSGRSKNRR